MAEPAYEGEAIEIRSTQKRKPEVTSLRSINAPLGGAFILMKSNLTSRLHRHLLIAEPVPLSLSLSHTHTLIPAMR
ncbi:hypothetical protein VNO78_10362 [Psophocarpus tetragonolobus]|uniref:Uncharacterized protein n=1 Tax=Psophocarpus tetragonolobus TaxID=3891 RepID=A0AAN9SQZ6_PSOTE